MNMQPWLDATRPIVAIEATADEIESAKLPPGRANIDAYLAEKLLDKAHSMGVELYPETFKTGADFDPHMLRDRYWARAVAITYEPRRPARHELPRSQE